MKLSDSKHKVTCFEIMTLFPFYKNMLQFSGSSFIFVFCKRINPLPAKMKELASITRSTFSADDFQSTDQILATVGFC